MNEKGQPNFEEPSPHGISDSERNRMKDEMAKNTALVSQASSLEELCTILEAMPNVPGGHRLYTGKEIAGGIRFLAANPAGVVKIENITRTYGIRRKVRDLLKSKDT